jgi:diacylglycerol kinase (ATP)
MQRPRQTLWQSFRAAFAGVHWAWQSQRNFRIHVLMTVPAVALGLWLKLSLPEWCLLLLAIGSVLTVELLNTAIEAAVDLASPEWHELAKRAKDTAAAAVLVAAGCAVGLALLVFGPRLWQVIEPLL